LPHLDRAIQRKRKPKEAAKEKCHFSLSKKLFVIFLKSNTLVDEIFPLESAAPSMV